LRVELTPVKRGSPKHRSIRRRQSQRAPGIGEAAPVRRLAPLPQPDGSLSAVEVHIFPEAMRGTGEGHYPWDLRPQSTMTNANVEQVGVTVDGRTLTLKYKDGEKKIFVPADTPVVIYEVGDRTDLKPGAPVFIVAVKQPDGTLEGRAWRVGRNGAWQ
jgi:hypothetical protein